VNDKLDHAAVIVPPPLLLALCVAVGFIAQHLKRLPLFPGAHLFLRPLCVTFFALAAIIFLLAVRELIRHHTHPSPYKPTAELVVGGIYSWTRNPIYIAFLLIVLALAVGANSVWLLLSAITLFVFLHFGVVKPEEHYLSTKFGSIYDDYYRRVRRWV
jgi:protein-S-isoprenylcysteine O-methyltransferase Ste14